MGLTEYRKKRDFKKTAEPAGGKKLASQQKLTFVVQKHAASRLHYDFRLELGGFLKSWAVPKGPSLNPSDKRLAMHVEDHPIEYGDFEGIIPQGEYGGGTVMLWDQGHWEPLEDPVKGYRDGKLKFVLHGEKLRGGWMLVRRGGRSAPDEKTWFFFKERDDEASEKQDITLTDPLSVATGRDLDEIAAQQDRVWGSNRKNEKTSGSKQKKAVATKASGTRSSATKGSMKRATTKSPAKRQAVAKKKRPRLKLDAVPGARRASLPRTFVPQLATLSKEAPDGPQWLHEMKFDGYRMVCRIDGGRATLQSRNLQDWTAKFPGVSAAAAKLPAKQALLDGEVVALEPDGTSDFQTLQNFLSEGRGDKLIYFAFDLLYLDGYDLTRATLADRKEVLARLVPHTDRGIIRLSEHFSGSGPEFFAQACRLGLEGIISKRADRPYERGRGYDWLKTKCVKREEFVIGGYTDPAGARNSFGALLTGYYNKNHELVYAGRVGTGFTEKTLADLGKRLRPLEQRSSPFVNLSGTIGQARGVHWVKPTLVGQVEFTEWTREGILRHPSFQGLREDKPASEVVRDAAVSPEIAQAKAEPMARNGKQRTTTATSKAKSASRTNDRASDGSIEIAGVRLSSPDKVLYPEQGITKQQLAEYYVAVADWMLPHVVDRPLSLVRCPDGRTGKPCFFQKHPGETVSDKLKRIPIREKNKTEDYLYLRDVGGLVALVQMGVLEIHLWGSKIKKVEQPDRLIFDLDPDPTVLWPKMIAAAKRVRDILREYELESFLKTTGGKGLHVVVPIRPRMDWNQAKEFCQSIADRMVQEDPASYIATMSKAARRGKIFVDYLRNARGATSIAPYSTRSREGAPVSVPIEWEELTARLKPNQFTVENLEKRLKKLGEDPWPDLLSGDAANQVAPKLTNQRKR